MSFVKTLYLLRHAHAAESLGLVDIDRPLDTQGHLEAKALADYLRDQSLTVDFVMCSAALRTQETLEPLRPLLGTDTIQISRTFYNVSEIDILELVQGIPESVTRALYIGHNPGIAFAMFRLAQHFPEVLQAGVGPATFMGLQFSCETWAHLKWGQGKVTTLFQPPVVLQESPAPKES